MTKQEIEKIVSVLPDSALAALAQACVHQIYVRLPDAPAERVYDAFAAVEDEIADFTATADRALFAVRYEERFVA